jgi:hypothetical protein
VEAEGKLRYTQQVSVYELKKYWGAIDALPGGDQIKAIPLPCMPPWADLCSELDWKSCLLENAYFGKKDHRYCGVYRLIGLATEGDLTRPATLNRLCGQDTTGTLYIGQASSLDTRLNQLRQGSHNAIRMLRSVPLLQFPSKRLAVAFLFTGLAARSVERDLIKAYMNSFGDTPPLNYST